MKKLICIAVCAFFALAAFPVISCASENGELTKYAVTASYDGNLTLTASCLVDCFNATDNALDRLEFHLYPNAYREGAAYSPVLPSRNAEAYYNGESYGSITVSEVTGCKAWELVGEDENILVAELNSTIYPDERAQIRINYTLKLAEVNHRLGKSKSGVNLGNFYPVLCVYGKQGFIRTPYYSCGDPFLSDCADYEVTLSAPESFIIASSGKLSAQTVSNGQKTATYALNNARDFALVLSEDFEVFTAKSGDTEVKYYALGRSDGKKMADTAAKCVNFMENTFGEYAYPVVSIVETGFCYGGMEYPSLVMISDGLEEGDKIYTAVHEIAHQWWYAAVGSDQINNAWQDEGLAEYSALMFFEANPEYGFTRTGLYGSATKAYRAYFSVYNQIFGDANTAMTRGLDSFTSEYEYVNIAYNKGLLLFENLRVTVGDSKFCDALKNYYKNFRFKIATPENLIGCFTRYGADIDSFFKSYLEGRIII